MKLIMILLAFSLLTIISCKKSNIENIDPQLNSIVGEWRYVRTTSMTSSFICYDNCPDFDYEKSKYKITFDANGNFNSRVNLLIINGKYSLKNKKQTKNSVSASIAITEFQVMNRPLETPEDSKIKELLENSKSLIFENLETKTAYDYLSIHNGGSEYLFFVRKK